MSLPDTTPPPSAEAKALRAISDNLDVLGECVRTVTAESKALREMAEGDAQTLGRIERKLDAALDYLKDHAARVDALELWRSEHERHHAYTSAE